MNHSNTGAHHPLGGNSNSSANSANGGSGNSVGETPPVQHPSNLPAVVPLPQPTPLHQNQFFKKRWPFLGALSDGTMTIDGVSVKAIAAQHGTPVYVLSEKTIRARMAAFKAAFPYEKLEVQYAAKCNSNLSILRLAKELGIEVDASSVGEIMLALLADHEPGQITFTNMYKTAQDILFAAKVGVKAITVDSNEEIDRVEKVGEYLNKKIGIFLRINPLIRLGRYSTLHHKYGVPLDVAKESINKILASPNLELIGFHFHGAYIDSPGVYSAAAEKLMRLAKYVREKGTVIKYIDLGGGFPIEHDSKSKAFDLAEIGPKIIAQFKELVKKYGFSGSEPTLIFEPGKYLVGNAGIGLVKAVSVKGLGNKRSVVVDGSTYAFVPDPLVYDWYYEILPATRMTSKPTNVFDIAGNTCDSADIIGFDRKLPEKTAPGDLLAIMDCGGYSNVVASNFNTLKRAPIVMIGPDGQIKLVRRRERYADMFSPELDVLKVADPHELKTLTNLTRLGIGKDILGEGEKEPAGPQ
jgi:diaminopimelate decarboxylase